MQQTHASLITLSRREHDGGRRRVHPCSVISDMLALRHARRGRPPPRHKDARAVADVAGDARGARLRLRALLQVQQAHVVHRAGVLQHLARSRGRRFTVGFSVKICAPHSKCARAAPGPQPGTALAAARRVGTQWLNERLRTRWNPRPGAGGLPSAACRGRWSRGCSASAAAAPSGRRSA